MYCWKCKNEIEIVEKIGRSEMCPKCSSHLHCCFNCKFYDKLTYHECREPQAEWVKEKDSANFCDYFSPTKDKKENAKTLSKEEAEKRLRELLKGKRL